MTFLTRNTRNALGATDSYYTTNSDFGDETHYWHGVDLSFNARMRNGLVLQARHQHRPRRQRHLRDRDGDLSAGRRC